MNFTRRDLGSALLAAVPLAKTLGAVNSKFGGVQIGAITYSFREVHDLDTIIADMVKCGLGEAELMSNQAEADAGAPTPPRPQFGPGRPGAGGPGGPRPQAAAAPGPRP